MTIDETIKDLEKILRKLKPNPNNYLIVNKWNYKKVYLPNSQKIFELVSDCIDSQQSVANVSMFENFANVKDIE